MPCLRSKVLAEREASGAAQKKELQNKIAMLEFQVNELGEELEDG